MKESLLARGVFGDSCGVVARALSDMSFDVSSHAVSLLTIARKALATGDHSVAWLAADRLCRVTGGAEATPLLLRAAALASMGDTEASAGDLEQAWLVNPEHPLVLEMQLAHPSRERRVASARALIRASGGFEPRAMDVLGKEGITPVGLVSVRADQIVIRLRTAGAGPLLLTTSDAAVTHKVAMTSVSMTDHAFYRGEAEITMPWPGDGAALAFSNVTSEGLFEPATLHRFTESRPADVMSMPPRDGLMIIVPVYGDLEATASCLRSVCAGLPQDVSLRIIVVNDASPDPLIGPMLEQFAARGDITLLTNAVNLGFAASVNRALQQRGRGEDVLLLNADTLVPSGAIGRLRAAAHREHAAGTVTPLSNNGEDTSMPRRFAPNPLPEMEEIERLDLLAARVNAGRSCDMPNGVGFCLFIRGTCLDALGGLSTAFERGYYEDVEFCLRARAAGWRNLCALDCFVGHAGSLSFKHAKRALVRRNLGRLVERFADYPAESVLFEKTDPLRPFIKDLERAALAGLRSAVLIIIPEDLPGAVAMRVSSWVTAAVVASGDAPQSLALIVRLAGSGADQSQPVTVTDASGGLPQDVTFSASQWLLLAATLADNAAIADVICVDPARLPGDLARPLLEQAATVKVILTDSRTAFEPLPGWLAPSSRAAMTVMVETSAMRDACMKRLTTRDVQLLPGLGAVIEPPRLARGGPLVVVTEALDPLTRSFLATLAKCLADTPDPQSFVLLGEDADDLSLMRSHRIWVSGEMPVSEWARWAERLDAGAVLFASRSYGLTHPAMEHWARHVPVACFDMAVEPSNPWFSLAPDVPDVENALVLRRWLHDMAAR